MRLTTGGAAATAENRQYVQIFDYLSASSLPSSAEATVVFGRHDPLVAKAFGDLIIADLVTVGVISGGIGKDSGTLLKEGFKSEADYVDHALREDAHARGYSLPPYVLDRKASSGTDNARNSAKALVARGVSLRSATANTHAASGLRLAETLQFEIEKMTGVKPTVYRKTSAYDFKPESPADRDEVAKELLRLADWPAQKQLGERRADLPEDLVEFVRKRHGSAPKPAAPWQGAVLRLLGPGLQQRVIKLAAKHEHK